MLENIELRNIQNDWSTVDITLNIEERNTTFLILLARKDTHLYFVSSQMSQWKSSTLRSWNKEGNKLLKPYIIDS